MQSTVCPVRSARCLSKSNMALAFAHDLIGKPLPTFPDHALTISVFAVEIAGDILANGRLARGEAGVIAGAAQVLDGALREILVLAADRVRHLDIFDIGRPPERLEPVSYTHLTLPTI